MNLPLKEIFTAFGGMIDPQVPPPMKKVWTATKHALTGSLTLSFARSILHPKLSIGIKNIVAAKQLINAVNILSKSKGLKFDSGKGIGEIVISIPNQPTEVSLYYLINQEAIHVSLFKGDLLRIQNNAAQFKSMAAPSGFAQAQAGLMLTSIPEGIVEFYQLLAGLIRFDFVGSTSLFEGIINEFVSQSADFLDLSAWLSVSDQGAKFVIFQRQLGDRFYGKR